jgi:HEAT repeat protein
MAECAPRQILGYLPDIVKALREVLNDTHEKVHEAAIAAIAKIGSVIKCPEVAEMLDVIIKALGDSNTYLINCLDGLLDTSFVHFIDAPSLSLLIPLVDIGLTMHDSDAKQKSSQLVGNICSLTQEPEDLLPYMKILIPAIKASLFDPIPEIRASAAKAIGKLSKGLGLANSIELLDWLNTNLKRPDMPASERSGAAQGLSEVVSSHGDNFFGNQCKEIFGLARSEHVYLRESYRTVLAFMPTSNPGFVKYLRATLPIIIDGLGDESEEVRRVSLRNVRICIQ